MLTVPQKFHLARIVTICFMVLLAIGMIAAFFQAIGIQFPEWVQCFFCQIATIPIVIIFSVGVVYKHFRKNNPGTP